MKGEERTMKLVNYYEDPQKPHVNVLPDRAYFIPFANEKEAGSLLREDSPRFQSLNGSWKFAWYANPAAVPEGFYLPEYETAELGNIDVPGCWQPQGYDHYHYVGARQIMPIDPPMVPVDNPCGTYILDFYYDACDELPITELVFEGVDSCYYVWLNGKFVGYSEVSHALSTFDISPYIQNGKNRLAVLNLKWCVGTYFEIQDKWRMTGIFRDVYLIKRPQVRLIDFYTKQVFYGNDAAVQFNVDLDFASEGGDVQLKLVAPDGCVTVKSSAKIQKNVKLEFLLDAPTLWNAEQPNLYTLYIILPNEVIAQKIGFRHISVEKGVLKVNHQPIKLRGVNRHDTDPVTAYTVSREHIIRDFTLMKRNNINAVRTAHYQNSPIVIEIANEMGFYIMSEADYETNGMVYSHGSTMPDIQGERRNFGLGYRCYCPILNDDPRYEKMALDRMLKNPIRDKNQPSVIFWSLGNESGWGRSQERAAAWIKEYDPSRLLHYESMYPGIGFEPDYSNIDVLSRMYPSTRWIQDKYGDIDDYDIQEDWTLAYDEQTEDYVAEAMQDHPFLLCEFAHAMGNSSGDMEDYYSLMLKHDRFIGGFVWEWADHAKYIGDDKENRPMYQYGGDSGEFPTDGGFCMDGLNYPDRRPHTSLLEYKNVIRPIRAAWSKMNQSVLLRNYLNFVDAAEELEVHYELTRDGEVIAAGPLKIPSIPAGTEREVMLPITPPTEGICYLRLVYKNKNEKSYMPAGFELGFDQLQLDTQMTCMAPWFEPAAQKTELHTHETDRVIVIYGESDKGEFEYTFDKKLGTFKYMKINGRQLLDAPMEYNIFRAPTDNDLGFGFGSAYSNWVDIGYDSAITRVYKTQWKKNEQAVEIVVSFSMAAIYRANVLKAETVWKITAEGLIELSCDVERTPDLFYLPRFGIRLFINKEARDVKYFAYGPTENYPDKHHACYMGFFQADVDELFEDYVRPQENGSHGNAAYLAVNGKNGAGLQVIGNAPFSFNVSRYTQEELLHTDHNYELTPSRSTVVCLDYKNSGIGSNSCGPQLLPQYQLKENTFSFNIKMLPKF